jgi:ABC-type Fe3+/spermidine/putrescine transport system ATPase subunit
VLEKRPWTFLQDIYKEVKLISRRVLIRSENFMIRTTGITKAYGNLKVLKGIDILIQDKEVVSIVGASGAGKTTLLQIIGTLDRPDGGSILL